MSVSQTTNLGLFKPQDEDYVDVVADIDDNMDIIDAAIGQPDQGKSLQDEIDDVEANVGNVPSGTTVQGQIDGINDKIGTVPSGSTLQGEIDTLGNNAIQYATYGNNTLSFFRNATGTGTAAFVFNLPEEMFLDQAHTAFVGNFAWSSTLYPGSTDPNLDGKPVLVLAVKGDATNPAYSFVDMTSLVDVYTAADASITVSNYTIGVQIDPTAGNALTLVSGKGLRVDITGKANKASSVTNGNLLEMDANGDLVNSGKKVADFVLVSNIGTDAEFQDMIDDYYS